MNNTLLFFMRILSNTMASRRYELLFSRLLLPFSFSFIEELITDAFDIDITSLDIHIITPLMAIDDDDYRWCRLYALRDYALCHYCHGAELFIIDDIERGGHVVFRDDELFIEDIITLRYYDIITPSFLFISWGDIFSAESLFLLLFFIIFTRWWYIYFIISLMTHCWMREYFSRPLHTLHVILCRRFIYAAFLRFFSRVYFRCHYRHHIYWCRIFRRRYYAFITILRHERFKILLLLSLRAAEIERGFSFSAFLFFSYLFSFTSFEYWHIKA